MTTVLPNLITLDEACSIVRCSRDALRARLHRGQLTRHHFGRRVLLDRDELLTLIRRGMR
jgi:excisionase family DNA binding protein